MRNLKKGFAVLLAVLMLVSVFTIAAYADGEEPIAPGESGFYVTGDSGLTGAAESWKLEGAVSMIVVSGGKYVATMEGVAKGSYDFKIIKPESESQITWYGDDGEHKAATGDGVSNFKIVVAEDNSTVEVSYAPGTSEVTVEGAKFKTAEDFEVNAIYAAGTGKGTFLNGATWSTNDGRNKLKSDTEAPSTVASEPSETVYTSSPAEEPTEPATKAPDEPTQAPTTEPQEATTAPAEVTTAPAEATTAPAEATTAPEAETTPYVTVPREVIPAVQQVAGKLRVSVTSNIAKLNSQTYDVKKDKITLAFKLTADLKVISSEGTLTYDSKLLKLDSFVIPNLTNTTVNTELVNKAKFNSTDFSTPADFSKGADFIVATFSILGEGQTVVDLDVIELVATSGLGDIDLVDGGVATDKFTAETVLSEPYSEPTSPAKTPKLNATSKKLAAGKTFTIKVSNNKKAPSFSSDKTSVAKVSKTGKVTALKKGKATIKVKVDGKTLKCKITVSSDPKIKIGGKAFKAKKTYTVKAKKSIKVNITGKASAIKNSYKSSNKKIAKVSGKTSAKSFKIKGVKKGTATITLKVNKTKTFKIKVKVTKK